MDANGVGAGGEVLGEPIDDCWRGSVGDQRVDQGIAACARDVVFFEPVSQQVVGVVAQPKVWVLDRGPANGADSL